MIRTATLASALVFTGVVISGCVQPVPPETDADRERRTADYKQALEDQLGITRARQRAEVCAKLPAPSIGMTEAKVLASCWGRPDHSAQSVTASGKDAVWAYPEGYVYLTNGVVTKIVTSR